MTGCAWTDVVADLYPPQSWDPDDDAHGSVVILLNLGWALLLTALSVGFLCADVDPDGVFDATSRDDVERSFITGALIFFVGWQWNIVHRNVVSVVYLTDWSDTTVFGSLLHDDHASAVIAATTVSIITLAFFTIKHKLMTGQWWGSHADAAELRA